MTHVSFAQVEDRPPVTLALFAYRQERYVEEAVRGALAQTYSPLQIILSDDCSPDRTFEIMRSMASAYQGPHQVLLNRNERNLGLSGHLNRVAELASGEIIILAAGDDVSLPHRVEALAAEFARSPEAQAVFSGYVEIGPAGERIREVVHPEHIRFFTDLEVVAKAGGWVAMGATFGYRRRCLTVPRPIPEPILCEDCLLPFRAALLGSIRFVREPLILYRTHPSSATAAGRFDNPQYRATHFGVLSEELDWALDTRLISRRGHSRGRKALAGWLRFDARARRLRSMPLLARLHYAFYYSDVWRRRILARFAARGRVRNGRSTAVPGRSGEPARRP